MKDKKNIGLDKLKTEVASELGIQLKDGDNGDLPSKDAGRIGGEMVKQMINDYKKSMK